MASNTATKSASSNRERSLPSAHAYQRIADDIRARVRDGRLSAGAMLASRHNLAKEYGVALSTAQQAIASLLADGTLKTLDRRGTFVADSHTSRENGAASPLALPTIGDFARPVEPTRSTTARLGIIATSLVDQAASPDVGSLWARQAIRALEDVFSAADGTTFFFDRYPESRGPYEHGIDDPRAFSMTEAIQALTARGVDAFAIVGLCDGRDVSDEIVAAVDVEKVPVVYISWHEMRPPVAQVFYDSRHAGYQAAQHLLRKGYDRLLFLTPFSEPWLTERIDGARDAIRHAGLPPETLQTFPAEPLAARYDIDQVSAWTDAATRAAIAHFDILSASARSHWAIIAPNDFTALAVQRAAADLGATAGLDYGLIGFDDDPLSVSAGLTTVRPPIEAMGEEAGRMLLRALAGESSGLQLRLRSRIIPRASTTRAQTTETTSPSNP